MLLTRPKFWDKIGILAILLLPLAGIYTILGYLRLIYAFFKGQFRASGKVICTGNHVVGGSGKTPVSLMLGKYYKELPGKSCFVCVGAGGNYQQPQIVDRGLKNDYLVYGDEALMLSEVLPVIVAKNKADGVQLADQLGFDRIIVDDGLQNPFFSKDLSILVYNREASGNNLILPAGPCRENFSRSLAKSSLVIDFSNFLPNSINGKPVFKAKRTFSCACPKTNEVVIFSSIANNYQFKQTVLELGYIITKEYFFPDHHQYNSEDLNQIFEADGMNRLTTHKDYCKLPDDFRKKLFIVEEKVEIVSNAEFKNLL